MPDKPDYYDLLDVSRSASPDEIKRAYRQKALEYHPDRNKSADSETKFKQINQAYEILSNPKKREAYDQFGHAAFDPTSGFSAGGGSPFGGGGQTYRQGPFSYTYYGGGSPFGAGGGFEGFSDPFEIFESFFGSAAPFGRAAGRRPKPHYSLKIDFLEAAKGEDQTSQVGPRPSQAQGDAAKGVAGDASQKDVAQDGDASGLGGVEKEPQPGERIEHRRLNVGQERHPHI